MKITKKKEKIKVLVAILTYNCESKIMSLIENIADSNKKFKQLEDTNIHIDFRFFDDCSTDRTLELLKLNADKNNIVPSSENLGYGGNVKRSFSYGLERNSHYLAVFPGDMQRDFNDLLNMLRKLSDGNYDVVVGKKSNFIKFKDMPLQRKFGNLIFSRLAKIWGDKTHDPLAGFKIYKIETCKDVLWLCQNRFGFDLDFSFWSSFRNLEVYPYDATVTYENHISSMPSTFFQGLTLLGRFFILGFIIQPVIKILQSSTKK